MRIKSEGGQWSPTKPVGELNTIAQGPPAQAAGSPPRSVVFSRDGVFVEGGARRGGGRANH